MAARQKGRSAGLSSYELRIGLVRKVRYVRTDRYEKREPSSCKESAFEVSINHNASRKAIIKVSRLATSSSRTELVSHG